ncbi:hypothetical protein ACEN9J_34975 [Variovorax sp. Varisp41]|jgi:hypothetical protein|uniref:hypothetical protein n=1 Tax=unclassified Variovorax TaxID=663243 RepID=UPI000C369F5D|nr:hypothetical protein [Variovorax sp.]MBS75393.1 hypothetical protein [Variovorax sp.]
MLSYAIQKVGDDFQQTHPQGETTLLGFMAAIDAHPWQQQHREWNEQQDGPLPALVLRNEADQRELWVTLLGDGTDRRGEYQLQSVAMRPRRGFFGKGKLEQDVAVFETRDRGELDRLCELFCDGQYEALDREAGRMAAREDDSD